MHHDGFNAADHAVRLVENAELMQHCGAVVIDLLASQPILGVEGENAAKRKLHRAAGRRQPAPRAQMMSTDYNFQEYGIPGDVALAHFDGKVGHGAEQSIVIRAHRFTTDVMIIPRLLVIARRCAKGAHYAIEVVPVLQADVLLD